MSKLFSLVVSLDPSREPLVDGWRSVSHFGTLELQRWVGRVEPCRHTSGVVLGGIAYWERLVGEAAVEALPFWSWGEEMERTVRFFAPNVLRQLADLGRKWTVERDEYRLSTSFETQVSFIRLRRGGG